MPANPLTARNVNKLRLLRTLRSLNNTGNTPTLNELIDMDRADGDVPRQTRDKRRSYIRGMIMRGLIEAVVLPKEIVIRLRITPEGRANLVELGYFDTRPRL